MTQLKHVTEADENSIFQMKPGEYVEDKDINKLANDLLDSPIITSYEVGVYETQGSKKNHLYFTYESMDIDEIQQKHSVEEAQKMISSINKFIEEITGRDVKLRSP